MVEVLQGSLRFGHETVIVFNLTLQVVSDTLLGSGIIWLALSPRPPLVFYGLMVVNGAENQQGPLFPLA